MTTPCAAYTLARITNADIQQGRVEKCSFLLDISSTSDVGLKFIGTMEQSIEFFQVGRVPRRAPRCNGNTGDQMVLTQVALISLWLRFVPS
jgi:hypothetical protein